MKQPIYIEFYGMPGCGKTTVSHILADNLRAQGYTVSEPNYELVHGYSASGRKLKKMLQTLRYLAAHIHQTRILIALIRRNGYCSLRARTAQIINLTQKLCVYNSGIQGSKAVVWDQGLIQAAVSLSVGGGVDADDNLQALKALILPGKAESIISVLLQAENPELERRIMQRGTSLSRIEKTKDKTARDTMLEQFHVACMQIKDCSFCAANSEGKAEETAARIMAYLTEERILA